MIKVKYNYKRYSHDGYSYKTFDNYEDFGYWIAKNYSEIIIWEIKE